MGTTVKQRIIAYLKAKSLSQKKFEEAASLSNGYVNNLKSAPSAEKLQKMFSAFPDLNESWLLTGEGSMLKSSEQSVPDNKNGIPFYDQDFACGFLDYTDAAAFPTSYVNLPGTENATCWCRASGISMQPLIDNGDYVCLQRIDDPIFLVFGETYAFDCINGMRTIKKLGRGSEPDTFRLIPVNKEVDEQDIPKSVIRNIFRVVAVTKYL